MFLRFIPQAIKIRTETPIEIETPAKNQFIFEI